MHKYGARAKALVRQVCAAQDLKALLPNGQVCNLIGGALFFQGSRHVLGRSLSRPGHGADLGIGAIVGPAGQNAGLWLFANRAFGYLILISLRFAQNKGEENLLKPAAFLRCSFVFNPSARPAWHAAEVLLPSPLLLHALSERQLYDWQNHARASLLFGRCDPDETWPFCHSDQDASIRALSVAKVTLPRAFT